MSHSRHAVFIDPSSREFLGNRLFDANDPILNRDGTLLPFIRLRDNLLSRGISVHTADYLRRGEHLAETNHYWSFGLLEGHEALALRSDVRMRGFILFEPPLVANKMYSQLSALTSWFEEVHIHNVLGDGYSLAGVDRSRLRKLYWPQPYNQVDVRWKQEDRLPRFVMVSGNHNPGRYRPEYYSTRLEVVAAFNKYEPVDLYGRGWDRTFSRQSMWLPYWRHRHAIKRSYRGTCESKSDILGKYRYSICFENMPMTGYVTEKIIDCLYSGSVPLYLGAPDIADYVPKKAFVNVRDFTSWEDLYEEVKNISDHQWSESRRAGKEFIESHDFLHFYDSLNRIVYIDD